jgi:electron transfer flavoprotein alpha subunit
MTVLVIAEHDNNELQLTTLNTITAGLELGDQVDLLVAGSGCEAVVASGGSISGISGTGCRPC